MRYRIDQIKIRPGEDKDTFARAIKKKLRRRDLKISDIEILKESIDARKKPDVRLVYSLSFECPQKLDLPHAPKPFIRYMEEDDRPQVKLDVDYEGGMGITIGRLREDTIYDYKFVGLSHNTVRGAAGGALLCAELLTAKGYIQFK